MMKAKSLLCLCLTLLLCLSLMPAAGADADSVYAAQPQDLTLPLGQRLLPVNLNPAFVGSFDAQLESRNKDDTWLPVSSGQTGAHWNAEGVGGLQVSRDDADTARKAVFRYKISNGTSWENSDAFTVTWQDLREPIYQVAASVTGLEPQYGGAACNERGLVLQPPEFTVTTGLPAYFNADGSNDRWYRLEDAEWVSYKLPVFKEGTYRYYCQVRVDRSVSVGGKDGTTHVIGPGCTVTVNDQAWEVWETPNVGSTFSFLGVYSPSFTVRQPAGSPLQIIGSVTVPKSVTREAIEPLDCSVCVMGGKSPYVFTKVSGPDWLEVSKAGQITGTPVKSQAGLQEDLILQVRDQDSQTVQLTLPVAPVSLCPEEKEKITAIEATVTGLDIFEGAPACKHNGDLLVPPKFTVTKGSPAYFKSDGMNSWEKWNGSQWNTYTDPTFAPGKYRYSCQIRIDDDGAVHGMDGRTHVIAVGCTIKVNGQAWTSVGQVWAGHDFCYCYAESPEIVVEAGSGPQSQPTPNAVFEAHESQSDRGVLFNLQPGQEYSFDGIAWNQVHEGYVELRNLKLCTIRVIHRGDGITSKDSEIQTITITRAPTPTATTKNSSTNLSPDGKILGLQADCTYWYRGDGDYLPVSGQTEITGLPAGRYRLWLGGHGTVLASDPQDLTIEPERMFFATPGPITEKGLTVTLHSRTAGTLWAAGYDAAGRLTVLGTCPVESSDETAEVQAQGFPKAHTIRLFLLNQNNCPRFEAIPGK